MRPALRSALVVLAAALPSSDVAGLDSFDDGLFEAECVAPTAGWFVPFAVLRNSFAVPPESVVAASRPMTAAELAGYASGGEGLLVSEDYLLFAFPNQGVNAFLWTGSGDGSQQVFSRAWDGTHWNGPGFIDGRADSSEFVFRASPPDAAVVHVLVFQQGGRRIRTERVRLARFPGTMAILERGLERADAVVWLPPNFSPARWPLRLDCLKGEMDVETLRSLPDAQSFRTSALVFLSGSGANRRVDFTFDGDSGVFESDFGKIVDPDFDRTELTARRHLRWRLARRAAGKGLSEPATLSVVDRGKAGGDGWIALELAVGSDAPGELYTLPIMRHQRDGGDPLFRFEIRRDGALEEITTRGRFGADSFGAAEPEPCDRLGLDFRFVRSGPGVAKLEIRPRTRPWRGEVRASVIPWTRIERRSEERVVTSPVPIAAD